MNELQGLLIKATGEVELIAYNKENSYKTIKNAVAGLIQPIDLEPTITLWLNEEGKLDKLPYNHKATALWVYYFDFTDYISGDVFITGGTDENGDTLGISLTDSNKIQLLVSSIGEPPQQLLDFYDQMLRNYE